MKEVISEFVGIVCIVVTSIAAITAIRAVFNYIISIV